MIKGVGFRSFSVNIREKYLGVCGGVWVMVGVGGGGGVGDCQ